MSDDPKTPTAQIAYNLVNGEYQTMILQPHVIYDGDVKDFCLVDEKQKQNTKIHLSLHEVCVSLFIVKLTIF